MKLQTFTVQSKANKSFPHEMLCAESAFPMNPSSANDIANSMFCSGVFTISLGRYVKSRKDLPLSRQWESHGWAVLESQTR